MEFDLGRLRFPDGLADRFLAYFPNPEVSLVEGMARDNIWDAHRRSVLHAPDSVKSFQFLLIFPRGNLPEVTANVHFAKGRMTAGPFISAGYSKDDGRIGVSLEMLSGEKDAVVEVSGVPVEARIAGARRISETAWRIRFSPKIRMELPAGFGRGISLGLDVFAAKFPGRASHFGLILPGPVRPGGYPKSFREVKLDVAEALGVVPKLFYMSSVAPICVPEGKRIGSRWLINDEAEITVRLFGGGTDGARLVFSHIRPDGLGDFEEVVKSVEIDFGGGRATAQDYRKCVFCAGGRACPMFRDFMEYIGNDTILRQII
jgi:hypothetical protein